MKSESIEEEVRALAGTGRKVLLTRRLLAEPTKSGFVMEVTPRLVMIEQFHDFFAEGFAVLRTSDLTAVRSGAYERQWDRMFAGEGILPSTAPEVPLNDIATLLSVLATWDENVILRCENEDDAREDFYIGRVVEVRRDTVIFANLDALGGWDADLDEIYHEEITSIELRTPYAKTFSKYAEGPCPHLGRDS